MKKTIEEVASYLADDPQAGKDVREMIDNSRFSTYLLKMRIKHSISQKALAEIVGISVKRLSKIENGIDKDLAPETFHQLILSIHLLAV